MDDHSRPGPDHVHHPAGDHQRGLDLDAEVFGEQLAAAVDLAQIVEAHSVVDLGAGTGVGSRLLRERYPAATITCVDNDPQMLGLLARQGFSTVQADLNHGFPELPVGRSAGDGTSAGNGGAAGLDLVWASSSLHHVTMVARLLSGVRGALAPHGVLVVVELSTLPQFLTEPADAALERRCHAAALAEGWNHYSDWEPALRAAGFLVTRSELTTTVPETAAAREYAQQWLSRFQHVATVSEGDRRALRELLRRPVGERVLTPRATRTVWVATSE